MERSGSAFIRRRGPGPRQGPCPRPAKPRLPLRRPGLPAPRHGLELLDSSPAFAHHIGACEQAPRPLRRLVAEEVLRDAEAKWLDRLDIVQPALFAVMVSLAKLWQQMGVSPPSVVGHSQGEIAAAHIAGALSLDDAALVVAAARQAMAKIAGKGAMLSVSLSAEEIEPRLAALRQSEISLAAINGPASLVLSGEPEALAELQGRCERDGVRDQPIAVDYAAHSAQIEALRGELSEAFAPISPQAAEIPFHSTVTGEPLDTAELGPEYWYRNLRQTVLMEPVLRSLLANGQRAFIEISPHPVLGFGAQETLDARPRGSSSVISLGTLRRDEGGAERFALSFAEAHAAGVAVDWETLLRGQRRQARLPAHLPLPARALLARCHDGRRGSSAPPASPAPSTRCWAPRSSPPRARVSPSPAASRSPPTPGLPITRRRQPCFCPAPPSSSWRCTLAPNSAPSSSRS